MGQVVVWGTGDTITGRYKVNADKVAVSASIEAIAGGIKVDWGNGDFEILGGTSWNPSTENSDILVADMMFSYNLTLLSSICYRNTNQTDLDIIEPALYSQSGITNSFGQQVLTVDDFYLIHFSQSQRTFVKGDSIEVYSWHKHNCSWGRVGKNGQNSVNTGAFQLRKSSVIKRITSNIEDFSERETTTDPAVSLLSGGCGVGINFTDSNIIIPLQSCPAWVRIEDGQACPEGSCECVHGSEKCCFDPNSGVIIKRIRLV